MTAPDASSTEVARALTYIDATDRETWVRMGMAVKAELGDAGFEVWDQWSRSTDNYEERAARDTWRSIKPEGPVTLGTLFHEAKRNGFRPNGNGDARPAPQPTKAREKDTAFRERKERKRQDAVIREAQAIWEAAEPCTEHPYLTRKRVHAHSLRVGAWPQRNLRDGVLLVPGLAMRNGELVLVTIQAIDDRLRPTLGRNKDNLRGAPMAETFRTIGSGSSDVFLIGEGYATVAAAHEATGHRGVLTFGKGGLRAVAKISQGVYPKAKIILLADRDAVATCEAIAREVGAVVAIPPAPHKDINDLWCAQGAEAVRAVIEAAKPPPAVKAPTDDFDGDPVLFGDIDTPEIPGNVLPGYLGEFAAAVARATQTPPAMAVLLVLATVATCVQRRFEVSQSPGYTEPLSLWTAVALPSASRKTAVISAVTAPVDAYERERAEELREDIDRNEAKRAVLKRRIEKLEREAAEADTVLDRDHLISEIVRLKSETPEELRTPRLWTGDTTPERLQGLLCEHRERMAVLTDEGGIFEVMAGLYSDGRANIDVFLQAHAGKAVRVDRGGRTALLHRPALTFGIAVQPEILRDFSRGSKRRFRGIGALARFLYAVPRSNIGRRDVTRHDPIPEAVHQEYKRRLLALLRLPAGEEPQILTLSSGARAQWTRFAAYVESNQGDGKTLAAISDWSGKLPGAVLRVAGLLHVAMHENPPLEIAAETIEHAADLAMLLIDHARAAFELIGADQGTEDAKSVLRWIQGTRLARFTRTDCVRATRLESRRLTLALELLEERQVLRVTTEPTVSKPTRLYHVHPAALQPGGAA